MTYVFTVSHATQLDEISMNLINLYIKLLEAKKRFVYYPYKEVYVKVLIKAYSVHNRLKFQAIMSVLLLHSKVNGV